jgi:hypothetical protein
MPFKNPEKRRNYARNYKRKKRFDTPYYALSNPNRNLVIQELNKRCILPRHMFEWRIVMKELLKEHFHKKIIKINKKMHLITQSYLGSEIP